MTEPSSNLFRGSLELLILKSLTLDPLHGVGIAQRINQITRGTIDVSFGSLFPAVHRMEERGWLSAEWRASANNRRAKYYKLTKAGHKQLKEKQRQWDLVVKALSAALRST